MLEFDEERDIHVDASAVQQRARERMVARKEKLKRLERDAAKQVKYETMSTFTNLSPAEYVEMRVQSFYTMPCNSDDPCFWRKEQKILHDEYLKDFKSVVPMQFLEIEKLEKFAYFKEALWVTEKMGLHKLMTTQENYNPDLIQQFYATVTFGTTAEMPFEWMSGTVRCRSSLVEFAQALEIPFSPTSENGKKMHVHGAAYDKTSLAPLYGEGGSLGEYKNLKLVYNILMRMFRHAVTPKAGNKDQIRLVEVNLLAHAHTVYCNGEEHENDPIDVMDFLFQEIFKCIMDRKCPLYAPYIMKLILFKEPNTPLRFENLVIHTPAKLQKKSAVVSKSTHRGYVNPKFRVPHEDEFDEEASDASGNDDEDEEMEDITTTRRGPRIKHASNTYSMHTTKEEVHKKFKKATWWQRFSFCRDVDIRHGQYESYKSNRAVLKSNKQVLQEVQKLSRAMVPMDIDAPGSSSQPTAPMSPASSKTLSYGTWAKGRCDWSMFEDVTSRAPLSEEDVSRPHGKGTATHDDDLPEASGSDEEEAQDSEDSEDYDDVDSSG